MFKHSNVFTVLVVLSQLFLFAKSECLEQFVRNKFQTFTLALTLNSTRTLRIQNFFLEGGTALTDLSLTNHEVKFEIQKLTPALTESYFSIEGKYNAKLAFKGNHGTEGTLLLRRRFSRNGSFNATIAFEREFYTTVHFVMTSSGYLNMLRSQTFAYYVTSYTFDSFFENISNDDSFGVYKDILTEYLVSATDGSLEREVDDQLESSLDTFWGNMISNTSMTDICLPPLDVIN